MNYCLSKKYAAAFAIFGGMFLGQAGPTFAQEVTADEEVVVIEAPIERTVVKRTSPTMETELIELKRPVSFSDLDLTRHEDVGEFESRIEAVATESCNALAEMFPFDSSAREVQRCIKRAIASAEEQKKEAIAAAN